MAWVAQVPRTYQIRREPSRTAIEAQDVYRPPSFTVDSHPGFIVPHLSIRAQRIVRAIMLTFG